MSGPTLVEFLTARIAEDEAVAQQAVGYESRVYWDDAMGRMFFRPQSVVHYERLTPDRLLAECEAKRRIVERHYVPRGDDLETDEGTPAPEWLIRILGSVYADHPDYREEWKP